jgi:DNA-binding NarL/FixJ family response regulator
MKEIAKRLFLGFETVHSYTKSLRQKLGCSNTASLVRIAIERHLV